MLQHVFGTNYAQEGWSSVSFRATDGYNAVIDLNNFHEPDAYLVFADLEHENWEPIPNHGEETVAPFYLIWNKEGKIPQNGFAWPWSIASIGLISLENSYSDLIPDQEEVSAEVYARI